MSKPRWKKIGKVLLWTLLGLLIFVVSIPFLLYVPFIQDFARKIVVEKVHESTGMDINISYLRLKFPLNLQVDSVEVIEASGDTLLTAAQAQISVALKPLLHKEIEVNSLSLDNASYRLGTPDSIMYLTARINKLNANDAEIPLSMTRIALREAELDGADIFLAIKDTIVPTPADTSKSRPLVIDVGNIALRNIRYRMTMLPTIDSLGAEIGLATLSGGRVDTGRQLIDVGTLKVDSVSATYLTPSIEYLKAHPVAQDIAAVSTSASAPWTITAQRLELTAKSGLYATRGAVPQPGFDAAYIQVSDVALEVDSFFNRATTIRVPLRHIAATERCGLSLMGSGVFSMDSTLMRADDFNLATRRSNLYLNASMGVGNLTTDPNLPLGVQANGTLSLLDVKEFMPSLSSYINTLPASAGLELNVDVNGTPSSLAVDKIMLNLPGYLALNAHGAVNNPLDFNRLGGKVDFNGTIGKLNSLKGAFLPAASAKMISIPPSTIKGSVVYSPGNIDGDLKVNTASGLVTLLGKWNQKAEGYTAKLSANRFPVNAFLPTMGIGEVTADVDVSGRGYNPASRATHLKASVNLHSLSYKGSSLGNIALNAALDTCRLTANVVSTNTFADLDADLAATFHNGGYQWDLSSDVRTLDLEAMHLSKTPMHGSGTIYTSGSYYPKSRNVDAEVDVTDFSWVTDSLDFNVPALTAKVSSTDSLSVATITSGDFQADVTTLSSLFDVADKFTDASNILACQIKERKVNIDSLQRALPQISLMAQMGQNNPVYSYLATTSGIKFKEALIDFTNDSLINLHATLTDFAQGTTRLDNIAFNANQHGKYLVYTASVKNRPGTMDDFANVTLNGFLADDKVSAMIRQSNIKGKQGFLIGFNAAVSDSTVYLRLVPTSPTIAYRKWDINANNFISYNFVEQHLDANLKVMSDSSYLQIYTEHTQPADSAVRTNSHQDDVIVKLANINLQEWLSISPFAPPVKGDVDADLRFRWDKNEITGKGTAALNNLYYGRERVGTFNLDIDVANDNRAKALHADVALLVDGQKVITATGALNDSTATSPFLLDFNMIHFPLRVVNPFLPKNVAQLSGMLNGRMDISGDLANPVFNGYLDFDSTAVKVGMTGASYKFSEERVPVDSNVVRFTDFSIFGLNNNPLRVNGTVDARHISDINFDLSLKANDMQIVNADRARGGADVYGKAFVDIDATAKGNLSFMQVNANLNVLGGTNVTYVMTDAETSLTSRSSGDMVHFVNFADTANVAKADSITDTSMAMILNANLIISEGSTINVDLSTDGKNKVSIQGAGDLDYQMTPLNGDGRLTGRFTINSGFVRYTPAINTGGVSMSIMSEKNFKFQEGSYVAFNGEILNPTLNITATDRLKANVTQSGQNSRLVNFDVVVTITNTLQNLNVAFNLTTDDDITIQNELASMSPEQRANQAMNMLLYNQYTGPGTKANSNLAGNPLYSFLASQLNTWAANNIKGVDISFGIDQYDTTTDGSKSTTTSYSYRVSKTLFNDRFKIVVGGNYSTDADADENFSQNLINDISFEYMLNRSGSMYVRLFRHVGFESILEGEITQTGVGFVMKRKLNSLRDLFRFRPAKADAIKPDPIVSPVTSQKHDSDSIR
ncbi:MAG: translocation/assembly module TamB [Bacteroides sp.]|nr:translocation/assembly module TamB [Bacteroides sp.]